MTDQPSVMIGCPWYVQVRPETAFSMAQTYLRLAMDGPTFISGVFDCPSIGLARAGWSRSSWPRTARIS